MWHDSGECEHNPAAVIKSCPYSCGACTLICMDQHESCAAWAEAGHCAPDAVVHHAFMLSKCPASCGVCSQLDSNFGVAHMREAPVLHK